MAVVRSYIPAVHLVTSCVTPSGACCETWSQLNHYHIGQDRGVGEREGQRVSGREGEREGESVSEAT